MKTKVFILGAGASKPAGTPVIKDFLPQGIFHLQQGTAFSDSLINYTHFAEYLKKQYNVDINDYRSFNSSSPYIFEEKNGVNIEQIISELDKRIREGANDLIKAREQAVRFVYLTLENACKDRNIENCYPDFVRNKLNKLKAEKYVIITFNYETLFEEALMNYCRGSYSYGIDVDSDKIIDSDFPSYEKNYQGNLLILKLHGSLNWAACSTCSKTHLFWSQQHDHIFSKRCIGCNSTLLPILVPPTLDKYFPKYLQNLWNMAKEEIAAADEITIIGYSLNDYDLEATSLIIDNIKQKRNINFYVADPDADKILMKIICKAKIDLSHFNEVALFAGFREYLDNIPSKK